MTAATVTLSPPPRPRPRYWLAVLVLALAAAAMLSLAVGPTGIGLEALGRLATGWLTGDATAGSDRERLVLLAIRVPRTVLAMLVGGGLALAGAVMQGLFRNPLADPGLIGVSSTAALSAVLIIALGDGLLAPVVAPLGAWALPAACLIGGLAGTAVLYAVASRHGRTAIADLVLAGIALAAFTGAVTGLVLFAADDRKLRDLTFWTLGSLSGASWPRIAVAAPFFLLGAGVLARLPLALNALLLGEAEARHLGIEVERTKRLATFGVAAIVAGAVSLAGVIGFVGVVVPHLVRLAAGPDHRRLLPGSMLLGASLILVADVLARMVVAPAELPIGIVTALLGGPFFFWLLWRRRGLAEAG